MKVTIVGGGPGGLYTAILLKAAKPSNDVTVYERNAPDDTFGFGVVFSAATLAELRAADEASFDAISDEWVMWDPVEVRYAGQRVRAGGNNFAAVSRHRLLAVLQQRARNLDVDLRFNTEVSDVAQLASDADVLVAADGINSDIRSSYAEHFGPKVTREGSKFIWLGTSKWFDAFTFIFQSTDEGLFQAHIYPFADDRSTFIVECDQATWQRAGLDAVDPETLAPGQNDTDSIAYLESLFAEHLDGHRLMGNNSKWLDWHTVRTKTWRHGRTVLLGDAAHTAHFSIGSGTKLAMEDAIALAEGLARHDDVDAALMDYESARRPGVEGIQQAAEDSLSWFERYHRYWGFPAPQFAYSLLTRSKRVDYDNMRRRARPLVEALDRWYDAWTDGRQRPDMLQLATGPAFTSFTLGGRTLANRMIHQVRSGEATALGEEVRRATDSGVAMVLIDSLAVTSAGRVTPEDLVCTEGGAVAPPRELLAEVRAAEAAAGAVAPARESADGHGTGSSVLVTARLVHAGPRGATRPRRHGVDVPLPADEAWPLLAASPVAYSGVSQVPKEMDDDDIATVVQQFVDAASAAAAAGFDALELQFGHGYLVGSFLSPLTNHREDAYGGEVHGRLTVPLRVLDAVREVWPDGRPLMVALSVSDLQPGGLEPDDAVVIARELHAHGADAIHALSGQTTPKAAPVFEPRFNADHSDLLRNRAGVPTIVSGHLPTVDDVNHLVLAGRADLCVLGLPLGRPPSWFDEDPDEMVPDTTKGIGGGEPDGSNGDIDGDIAQHGSGDSVATAPPGRGHGVAEPVTMAPTDVGPGRDHEKTTAS